VNATELRHLRINAWAQALGLYVIAVGVGTGLTWLFDLPAFMQVGIGVVAVLLWDIPMRPYKRARKAAGR
jgi:hypothetical protein